jgi:glyoxylase-like metal-dependent hydrolase (beta-lactamase superfamily II)/rhodanese-related sulfurtransferase
VLFRQVLHPDLGCASYVVADTSAGIGAVVDPKWSIDEYLNLARHHGFRIAHVVETHNHADHMSGRSRLVEATGADCWVSPLADAAYPHRPFADGDEVELGAVRLRALHVPGHRPEHTAVLIVDTGRSPQPCAVLTGDSLFVNDVARPDLAVEKRDGAQELFRSMRRLLELGDGVEVFPGHTGGSLCGSARMSETTSSTIGFERASNPMLALGEEDRFVDELVTGLAPQPPNFRVIAEANRLGRSLVVGELPELDASRLAERIGAGALAIDGRSAAEYDAAHVPGSVGVELAHSGFATKVAWIAEPDRELLVVAEDDARQREMQELLASVGLSVSGMLAGGFAAWAGAGRPVESFDVVDVPGLADAVARRPQVQVLDVRDDDEWEAGHIPGSVHVPYHDVGRSELPVDPSRPVAVICSTGRRSATAVGLVRRQGAREVIHVTPGGVGTWASLGHPIEQAAAARA